jgi:membrane protein implicated in regulation of membrane protease activity
MLEYDIIFWYWWVLAVFLLGVEILAPGFFFLWLALAGFIVGILLFLIPSTSFEIQLLIFGILSMVSILVWRRYGINLRETTDHPLLNKRGAQYIGRTFNLYAPIVNGRGKIKVDDSLWTVEGEDCDLDAKVKVIAVSGILFQVQIVKDKPDSKTDSTA